MLGRPPLTDSPPRQVGGGGGGRGLGTADDPGTWWVKGRPEWVPDADDVGGVREWGG